MPAQLFLPGMPEPAAAFAKGDDRLFLAIFPDASTATHIGHCAARWRTQYGLKGKPLATERFHVTLHHLGDYDGVPESIVRAAAMAAEAAAAATSPVEVRFDQVKSWPRSRVFVLCDQGGNASLLDFQRRFMLELAKHRGRSPGAAQFTPHVTLLYDDHIVAPELVAPVSWSVQEVVLVHSLLGKTRHIPLGRWTLQG
ncbi:MAG: 2'-5' RNA ligase family protein [Roseimicrobium sp.]